MVVSMGFFFCVDMYDSCPLCGSVYWNISVEDAVLRIDSEVQVLNNGAFVFGVVGLVCWFLVGFMEFCEWFCSRDIRLGRGF